MMMPARVALALQADGWWLRSEIIWAKPNPMPVHARERGSFGGLAQSPGEQVGDARQPRQRAGTDSGLGDPTRDGRHEEREDTGGSRSGSSPQGRQQRPWDDSGFIPCLDGKARRVESGTFSLAHGIPNRVGRLRAYGNAIVPQVAAAFIRAYRAVRDVA